MPDELHGDEPYVPEQEREEAEEAVSSAARRTSEEAEEAERALAETDPEPKGLPPTDEAPVPEDEEAYGDDDGDAPAD